MNSARLHGLLAPALVAVIAAGAGCDGGTRACKQGTLFVTIVFDGTTSAADEVGVGVSIDGGSARTARNSRTAGGTSETIEINFPGAYPTGKRVDVQVTAYMGGSPIAMKTGTVPSLPDGCAALTVTLEPGGLLGTGGTGGMGGGTAGRGGAGGSTSGAAGRGGSSAGTGGGAAGRGGTGGGTAGRGGTGGGTAGRGGTGGGTAGRGGTGGAGGLSCPLATFDTTGLQGFELNPFMDTKPNALINLAVREAGARATMSWDGTGGDPSAGSLKVDAPFDAYNQMVDIQHNYGTSMPKNWTGTKLHVRVKVIGGNPNATSPMGVQPYIQTGTTYAYCSQYSNLIAGNGWNDYMFDLSTCASPVDPSMVVGYGVSIHTGGGSGSSMPPMTATIYLDSFGLEGACPGGTGGSGGGSGAGGGGGNLVGCPASDTPPSALISDFSMMDGGTAVIPLGGPFLYGPVSPTATVQNGAWHITLAAPGTVQSQYMGVGIFFNGPVNYMNCIDAASYSGISFKLAGSVTGTGCATGVSINDSQHEAATAGAKGSGPAGSFSPALMLTPAQITSAGQTITVPFTGAGAPMGGSPLVGIDKSRLIGMSWQFSVAAGTANNCSVDITLDDVRFY